MKMIPISNNILINPEHISCIEQKISKNGKKTIYILCQGVEYEYEYEEKCPISAFLDIIGQGGDKKQFFAG